MITRKLGAVLRGQATPFQLFAACVLGAMLGFAPGFALAPALIVLLTHEIFPRDRVWVWGKEVQYAIDLGKPIICIRDGSFDFDSPKCEGLGDHIHLHETCDSVSADFQP